MAQSSSASGTSSRRHLREHDASSPGSPRYADSEWESKEEKLYRELEEAKARAAQMEKTMRWWSDCTANWREKWSKVRDERNKAKKEAKTLKTKLETAVKDLNTYKQESEELEVQNIQLKKEMEKIHMILLKHAGQCDQQLLTLLDSDPQLKSALGVDDLVDVYNNIEQTGNTTPSSSKKDFSTCKSPPKDSTDSRSTSDKDIEEYISQGAVPKNTELHKDTSPSTQEKQISHMDTSNEDLVQKMSMLNLRLEEATKTINAEREEKSSLNRGIQKLRNEVKHLRQKCEELQESRAEALKELLELKARVQGDSLNDLIDDGSNREDMDRRLSELRAELEKLQEENAAEWGKRERLESEKISLERENKQLRSELRELQERTESRRNRPVSGCDADAKQLQLELLERNKELAELRHTNAKLKKALAEKTTELHSELRELREQQERTESRRNRPVSSCDADAKQLQLELLERNKELADLRHTSAKLKNMLAEKTTELTHATRRSEQYEAEVKRIRARVEELKRELALAQDELDAANNSVRRLQRHNEDLNEQIEHYRDSVTESRAPDVVAEILDDKISDEDEDELFDRKDS